MSKKAQLPARPAYTTPEDRHDPARPVKALLLDITGIIHGFIDVVGRSEHIQEGKTWYVKIPAEAVTSLLDSGSKLLKTYQPHFAEPA